MQTRMNEEVRLPVEIKRIVLCGFMGAGKTTAGRLLAERLAWTFQDVDAVIEQESGLKIAQIFSRFGEPHFRQLEHETICRLLERENTVFALGGGAIEHPQTRQRILAHPNTLFVHLGVTMETVLSRCSGTETIRPVFNDRERLQVRYDQRIPLYSQAHLTIPTDDISAAEVANRLIETMKHLPQEGTCPRSER